VPAGPPACHAAPGADVRRLAGARLAVTAALGTALGTAALAAIPLAAAAPAAAGGGKVSVAIASMNPDIARPGQTVTVSGTVSNTTSAAVTGLSVQLLSSAFRLTSRGDLTNYAAGNLAVDSPVAGAATQLPGTLGPGGSEKWTVAVPVRKIGMTAFGVYPLAAAVSANGTPLGTYRSFLPFWPGKTASALTGPVQISWVWPLIDSPHQGACTALLDNSLATSLTANGRLGRLLAAAGTPAAAGAGITMAIDPGLLASVSAMKRAYGVDGTPTCTGATTHRAAAAARTWLSTLQSVTARQDFFVTPYDDVDVAALTHQGMDSDLTHAFNDGRSVARAILGSAQRPASAASDLGHGSPPADIGGIAWPAAGIADYGVLGSLAVNGIGTVILDSTMMPPVTQVSYTPSAVTQTPDGVGAELHVALADNSLTQILGGAPTGTGGRSAAGRASAEGASFATEQRFLAETAMIAAEAPALRRSVVVTPPRHWDPAPGVASALLAETDSAPWLSPVSLPNLVRANSQAGQVTRQQPPQQLHQDGLKPALLSQVRALNTRLRLHGSILDPPDKSYLSTAVAAVESSAWRGAAGQRQASRLLDQVSDYLASRERLVKIVDASQVTLGGQSGPVPVSISNKLDQGITVRLSVHAPGDGRIRILPYKQTVTVPAGQQRTVAVRVRAAAAGTTTLRLSLLTPGGSALPGGTSTLTVNATHFGTLALVIIGIAVAVIAATAAGRAFRRGGGPRGGAGPGDPGGGPLGDTNGPDGASGHGETDNVMRGPAERDDTPEEPDEYASTPGWAERP
jgi:Family of unknown function (DUF6049)